MGQEQQKEYERLGKMCEIMSGALGKFEYSDYLETLSTTANSTPMSEEVFERIKSDLYTSIMMSVNKILVGSLQEVVKLAQEKKETPIFKWGSWGEDNK